MDKIMDLTTKYILIENDQLQNKKGKVYIFRKNVFPQVCSNDLSSWTGLGSQIGPDMSEFRLFDENVRFRV